MPRTCHTVSRVAACRPVPGRPPEYRGLLILGVAHICSSAQGRFRGGRAPGRRVVCMGTSLLRDLATRRTATDPVVVRYDRESQTSEVFEDGEWVPSWKSVQVGQTKKCDMETGEDQKGQ